MLYDTSRSRRVHICGALRSRAKALHPDVRNTPDPLYISYIDFSISDTYSEFTKGMEPRLDSWLQVNEHSPFILLFRG